MQLINITNRLQFPSVKKISAGNNKKNKKKEAFQDLKNFGELLRSEFQEIIDAEFEEVGFEDKDSSREEKSYKDVLLPKFLFKCCYVNYYA